MSSLAALLAYDRWANERIREHLASHPSFEHRARAVGLFNHLLASQKVWHARITGADTSGIELWPETDLEESADQVRSNHADLMALAERLKEDGERTVSYTNSSGKNFDSDLSDILHHLVIHGQHHRAQIALLMRMSDIAPPPTDYIFFTRQQ